MTSLVKSLVITVAFVLCFPMYSAEATIPPYSTIEEVIENVNAKQLRNLITTTLKKAGLHSDAAVELLMLTAAQESRLGEYIAQIQGPARGIFQMEPATEADLWSNYIRYKPELAAAIRSIAGVSGPDPAALEADLAYQILMSRIHYLRKPEALPAATDVVGMATYWKKHYNTFLGAGTAAEAAQNYRKYCAA